jgi:hypothetical protein
MGDHIVDGEFKSDKYDWCPPGFVALKLTDKDAQPFLWGYAQAHRPRDRGFSDDLETALRANGFVTPDGDYLQDLKHKKRAWPEIFAKRLEWLISSEGAQRAPEQVVAYAERLTDLCIDTITVRCRSFDAKIDAFAKGLSERIAANVAGDVHDERLLGLRGHCSRCDAKPSEPCRESR